MRNGILDNNNFDTEVKTPNINERNKRKHMVKMIIWLSVLIFVIYQLIMLIAYTLGKVDKSSMWLYNGMNGFIGLFVKQTPSQTTEEFKLTLAGLGDVYATDNTLKGAKSGTNYDFTTGTEKVAEKLKSFDVVLASLNTPIADKSLGYSAKQVYNTPSEILDTLKSLNVTALATATRHSFDKNDKGVTKTVATIEEKGIKQTGINSTERSKPLVIEKNGIKIGVLSYATKSNVKMAAGKDYYINLLTDDNLKTDMEYLKANNADFIVAYLNIPNEDNLLVSGTQKGNVETLFNAGVNIVLGTGSLVIQDNVEDEIMVNDQKTHVYAIYSLGDFMGSYAEEDNLSSVIPNFNFDKKLTKNKNGEIIKEEKTFEINKPIGIYTSVTSAYKKTMYVIEDEITAFNSDKSNLTSKEYEKLKSASTRIKTLFNL